MINDNPDSRINPDDVYKQAFCGNLVTRSDATNWPATLIDAIQGEQLELDADGEPIEPDTPRRRYKITMAGTGREYIFDRAHDVGNQFVRADVGDSEVVDLRVSEIAIISRITSKPKPARSKSKTPA